MSVCASCSSENPDGARFCARCGVPLGSRCPACGATGPPDSRFCIDCGTVIDRSAPSPQIVSDAGERKQITVLFADVQGSLELQEDLDPEAWAGVMGRFVAILAEGVRKYGGTVDKFTGDGIMALFGAPVAQEDHARRACHAAWQLTKAIGEYAAELRTSKGFDLHVRLGLNSGEVVMGRVGDDVTLDPTALGHTVGLAQRMEAMAEPGRTYLTEHTARLVEGWFGLADLGSQLVKGAREPLRIYALEGPVPAPPTVRGGRALGISPLVGRDRELAVLEDALAAAMEGQAQVVGVVGEAGVGKSRLCDEFARSAAGRGVTVRRTTGVSHAQDVPLLPVLALMRDYFGITEANSSEEAREKLARRFLALDPELEAALPLLFDFLEVPDPERPPPKLAPEVRMRRIFQALHRATQRRSEREVLVLVFEDLHWFDPQSEVFLQRLIESFPGSRTLVITNFRPEFSATWMRHSYYRQLPLAPLRDQAVSELLGGLLGVDLSLAPLLGFVLERTGGNPFFVEEVVRALVDDGTLAGRPGRFRLTRQLRELEVPASVQAVLAARIDRLPERDKRVLQTAAVIGRTFSQPVLRLVTGLEEEDLDAALSTLCGAEFVQEESPYPVALYRFWHPLTQDVAYQGLLTERRARLHAAVAEAMIELDPDRLDEQAALVATHWEQAGEPFEAARWNTRAGNWALRSDLGEAWRRWRAAVELLGGVEENAESLELAVWARGRLVQYGARTGIDMEEAERLSAEGRVLAERLGDVGLLSWTVNVSGSVPLYRGEVQGARQRYLDSVRIAEATDDLAARAGCCLGASLSTTYTGPLPEGLELANRGLAACAGDQDLGAELMGYSPLVRLHQFRAGLLAQTGRLHEARDDAERALALARSRSEPEIVAWSQAILAQVDYLGGAGVDRSLADEAVHLGEEIGDLGSLVVGLEGLALAHLAGGRHTEAIAACERALAEARERRSGLFQEASVLAHLAQARLAAGDQHGAITTAEEAIAVARRQGARVVECLALLTWAQVRRATGEAPAAVSPCLDAALALVHETGALTYEPFIREELGRLRSDEGELRQALRLFRQIGATGHARRLEAELGASIE